MLVGKPVGCSMVGQGSLNHLPGIDRALGQASLGKDLHVDHLVLGVQEKRRKGLPLFVPKGMVEVVEQV